MWLWPIEWVAFKDLEELGRGSGRSVVSNSSTAEFRLAPSKARRTGKLIVGVLAICSRDCEVTEVLSSSNRERPRVKREGSGVRGRVVDSVKVTSSAESSEESSSWEMIIDSHGLQTRTALLDPK